MAEAYGYGNEEYGQGERRRRTRRTSETEEGCVPFADGTGRNSDDDEESRDLLIPRRVA